MGGPRINYAPVANVLKSPSRDHAMLLAEVREHTQRGRRVHVTLPGRGTFEVVQNGTCFMVRTLIGDVVGTWRNVAAALMGGEAHLDPPPPEDDPSDFLPRGAA